MRYWYVVLGGVVLALGLIIAEGLDRSNSIQVDGNRLKDLRLQLRYVAGQLRTYEAETDHYPSNDQGLGVVPTLAKLDPIHTHENTERLRTTNLGVITLFADPIVYENRRGFDASKFADSGATLDSRRVYSVCVDDGIYIWSVEGKAAEERRRLYAPAIRGVMIIALTVCLFLIIAFVRAALRSDTKARCDTWAVVVGSLIQGTIITVATVIGVYTLTMPLRATCYRIGYVRHSSAKTAEHYMTLMTKYRDRGIISEKAYAKMQEAAENPYQ